MKKLFSIFLLAFIVFASTAIVKGQAVPNPYTLKTSQNYFAYPNNNLTYYPKDSLTTNQTTLCKSIFLSQSPDAVYYNVEVGIHADTLNSLSYRNYLVGKNFINDPWTTITSSTVATGQVLRDSTITYSSTVSPTTKIQYRYLGDSIVETAGHGRLNFIQWSLKK